MSAAAALATTRPPTPWTKACGVCRRSYGTADWRELPMVTMLSNASVQPYFSVPTPWAVELRRCGCGAPLAVRC